MSTSIDRIEASKASPQRSTADRSARRLVGEAAPGESERTVGQLVADVSHDVSAIVRSEIQLAKSEVTAGLKVGGKGAGLLAGAAFIGLLGLIFLFHTIAQVIAIWLPVWAGYLITTVLLFLVAAVLGLLGYRSVKKAKPVPEKAIRNAQQTVEAIKPGR